MKQINIPLEFLPHGEGLDVPVHATKYSSGFDLRAAIMDEITLKQGERCLVPAGFKLAIPKGFEGQIRPRSGLAYRHGITVLNTPGTIDCDYYGEIKVILINLGQEDFKIGRGMRIAQMIIAPYQQVNLIASSLVEENQSPTRTPQGFGSTGLH